MTSDDQAMLRVFFVSFLHLVKKVYRYVAVLVTETLVGFAFTAEIRINFEDIKILQPIVDVACASES